MSNAYVKLKQILPPAPVLVGLVTAHHDEDDTSTVVLPTNEGRIEYAAGVAVGSTIRPRGTTVPVGEKAFVRNGVIETRAPDGDPIEIEVGRVVPTPVPLVFGGPIPDQELTEGEAFSLDVSGEWSGGTGALVFSLAAGTLPAGLALSSAGVIGGTPTEFDAEDGLVVRATDQAGYWADSNAFSIASLLTFEGLIATQDATVDDAFTLDTSTYFFGGTEPYTFSLASGTLPAGLALNTSTGVIGGTPTAGGTVGGVVVRAIDSSAQYADSNSFGFNVSSGAWYFIYDTFNTTPGAIASHTPEVGGAWLDYTSSQIVVNAAGYASRAPTSGTGGVNGSVWAGGLAPDANHDAFVEFEVVPAVLANTQLIQVTLRPSTFGDGSDEHQVYARRKESGAGNTWVVRSYTFNPAVDLVAAETELAWAPFVVGTPTKFRLEVRNSGQNMKLYVNDTLVNARTDMPPVNFRTCFVTLANSLTPSTLPSVETLRLNYFYAGYL